MKTKKSKQSFEENMQRLEDIISILDEGNKPLEELLEIYEEGMTLASSLREFLDKAEQKIIDITQKNNTANNSESED